VACAGFWWSGGRWWGPVFLDHGRSLWRFFLLYFWGGGGFGASEFFFSVGIFDILCTFSRVGCRCCCCVVVLGEWAQRRSRACTKAPPCTLDTYFLDDCIGPSVSKNGTVWNTNRMLPTHEKKKNRKLANPNRVGTQRKVKNRSGLRSPTFFFFLHI
jgi:hypothetical protein